jgi:SAM-dependent methyltransferase
VAIRRTTTHCEPAVKTRKLGDRYSTFPICQNTLSKRKRFVTRPNNDPFALNEGSLSDSSLQVPRTGAGRASRMLRGSLKRVPGLHSAWWLGKALRDVATTRPRQVVDRFDELYATHSDPWKMLSAGQQRRFRDAGEILDSIRAGRHFATAIEVGCAEGTFTRQMLAERCESLLATDVSRIALERARALCAGLSHVEFARWDILADSPPRTFELTVVMSVLEPFYRRRDLTVAREKMVALTAPNGYLLLSNTMHGVAEGAWWGRLLIHGANWQARFIGQHPKLKVVQTMTGAFYLHTLFRKSQ